MHEDVTGARGRKKARVSRREVEQSHNNAAIFFPADPTNTFLDSTLNIQLANWTSEVRGTLVTLALLFSS